MGGGYKEVMAYFGILIFDFGVLKFLIFDFLDLLMVILGIDFVDYLVFQKFFILNLFNISIKIMKIHHPKSNFILSEITVE